MPKVSINNNLDNKIGKKIHKKGFPWGKVILVILLLSLGVGIFFFLRVRNVYTSVFVNKDDSFITQLQSTIKGGLDLTELKGEANGQINVLLLGIGGEGHEGSYLSDTIILAQIRPKDKKVSLTHIPRDLYVKLPKNYGYQKINAAFALGFQANKDFLEAGSWARQVVEEASGLDIPYFAVIDFQGFKKAIDEVGGIDVVVDNTFTDSSYPNEKYGYIPPVTFTKGETHLDGKMALIFARSRHGTFPEGTDFARGLRQQKVIHAMKEKVTSLNLVKNISNLNSLLSVFADHFHTNIGPGEILHLYNITKDISKDATYSLSLDQQTGIICDSTQETTGAYILSYCDGQTIDDLHEYFQNSFTQSPAYSEKPRIMVLTRSTTSSEYLAITKALRNEKFTSTYWIYKALPTETVFYQVSQKTQTAKVLTDSLKYLEVFSLPADLKPLTTKADIIIFTKEE